MCARNLVSTDLALCIGLKPNWQDALASFDHSYANLLSSPHGGLQAPSRWGALATCLALGQHVKVMLEVELHCAAVCQDQGMALHMERLAAPAGGSYRSVTERLVDV